MRETLTSGLLKYIRQSSAVICPITLRVQASFKNQLKMPWFGADQIRFMIETQIKMEAEQRAKQSWKGLRISLMVQEHATVESW
ncbi:hypothetical protein DKK66_17920 [Aquitalea sp. USM4]|nr:hypothetical protein DKK66_17920 [Aquitalea sp. USM4]